MSEVIPLGRGPRSHVLPGACPECWWVGAKAVPLRSDGVCPLCAHKEPTAISILDFQIEEAKP